MQGCSGETGKQSGRESGRRMMAEVAGSEYEVAVDLVLIAAGFLGCEEYVTKAFGVERNARTNVQTEPGAYATSVKKCLHGR